MQLIVSACKLDLEGHYYAPELLEEQTLERLKAFGERLDTIYQKILDSRKR